MNIHLLSETPCHVETVAKMVFHEFVDQAGSTKTFDDVFNFFSSTTTSTFIAVDENVCVGTVSLLKHDCIERPDYTPWLASLYVTPVYRGMGIAEKLIDALLHEAYKLNHPTIYLRIDDAAAYYEARGWSRLEALPSGRIIFMRSTSG